ncbi:hypothetical protein V2S66_01880 [Streptomyces sp. V4-01]|uniref:Uncharacterized protein n=1 Tax=Actinacidiphila polyblastidii TaxID=3110430 RepID=A0ABU7P4I6_9ACTN|nr:hypothetical protein [Streptomyces sp. V4-01]
MADRSAPGEPSRPLDEQLTDLARATEPLVVLAGPDAARRRGERRRARRRAVAAGAVAVLALGVCGWQLLPGIGEGRDRGAPAASPTGTLLPDLPVSLDAALLPGTALPAYPSRTWKVVSPATGAAKFAERCPVSPDPAVPYQQAERVYHADDGSVAHYHLYEFADAGDAVHAAGMINVMIHSKCAHFPPVHDGDTTVILSSTSSDGSQNTVWLDHRGRFVAVLQVWGPLVPDRGKDTAGAYSAPVWACIDTSLTGLAPQAARSPGDRQADPSGSPAAVRDRPAAGSGSGASSPAHWGSGATSGSAGC